MENVVHQTALDETYEQLVVMEIAGESYGVDIGSVNTIIRMQEVTAIPRTPDFVEGVINLRGSIIPVIDLRKRFGLPVGETSKASRIVVVEAASQTMGMVVDAVAETMKLDLSAIEPPSPLVTSVDSAYVRGVGKQDNRLVILLDVEKVLSAKELDTLAKMDRSEKKSSKEPAAQAA
jgi:purine-binding chemotaxis protein CheW